MAWKQPNWFPSLKYAYWTTECAYWTAETDICTSMNLNSKPRQTWRVTIWWPPNLHRLLASDSPPVSAVCTWTVSFRWSSAFTWTIEFWWAALESLVRSSTSPRGTWPVLFRESLHDGGYLCIYLPCTSMGTRGWSKAFRLVTIRDTSPTFFQACHLCCGTWMGSRLQHYRWKVCSKRWVSSVSVGLQFSPAWYRRSLDTNFRVQVKQEDWFDT